MCEFGVLIEEFVLVFGSSVIRVFVVVVCEIVFLNENVVELGNLK